MRASAVDELDDAAAGCVCNTRGVVAIVRDGVTILKFELDDELDAAAGTVVAVAAVFDDELDAPVDTGVCVRSLGRMSRLIGVVDELVVTVGDDDAAGAAGRVAILALATARYDNFG